MVDQGIGTTFDSHVIAAYRFVMRYYEDGDKIYLFGFSRGAFTARFLARMIATIGVLSKGNEEMVPFAYKSYQDYENGVGKFKTAQENRKWMDSFRVTFCRQDVRVHFLGLFDTVNSVGYFDLPFTTRTYLPTVIGTANHIRHAVAIDERRCKFKAALLQQDINVCQENREDIKEVYFPGNHGDIGGGWLAEGDKDVDELDDPVQLSDIALEWMITELQQLPVTHPEERLIFNEHVDMFLNNIHSKMDEVCTARIHDVLRFTGDASGLKVIFWNFLGKSLFDQNFIQPSLLPSIVSGIIERFSLTLIAFIEFIPFFKRLELVDGKWVPTTFPPNLGGTRDIPSGAVFHDSVKMRMSKTGYRPKNQGMEALEKQSNE